MPSIITALAILGAAVLPDGADAAVPNGWVAQATLPDDGSSTFDPTKISLTVTDPGFDSAGNATVVTRTIKGTAIVRRQYANQAQRLNSASAGTRTVYFALSEDIYQGSTITAAAAAAGYYGAAEVGTIAGVTNGSSLSYPVPQFGWLNVQHERATGAGFNVEAVAYHEHACNGQQVACVEFYGRDAAGGNVTATQRASVPALSALQTQGPIVEAWKATIALAGLPQGDLCQVIAVVKPWIGPALDLSVAGTGVFGTLTAGTAVDDARGATPLRFVNDRTGGYGGAIAYVRTTGTLAGTSTAGVFAAAQAYPVANGSAYPTVDAALQAIVLWNTANKSHGDHSGANVYLMDDGAGGAIDHALNATSTRTAGKCWTEIRVAPGAIGQVRLTLASLLATADLLKFHVPIFISTTGNIGLDGLTAVNTKRAAFDTGFSLTYTAAPSTGLIYRLGLHYWRNVTVSGYSPWGHFGANRTCPSLVVGCVGDLANYRTLYPYTCVGNAISGVYLLQTSDANWYAHGTGIVLANNIFSKMERGASFGAGAIDGFARVQNVFEAATGFSAGDAAFLVGTGSAAPINNMISTHNTIPGVGVGSSNIARQNAIYTDSANTAGVLKRYVERFELLHQRNIKTDTFTALTTVSGRTGNWRYRYGVGCLGNVAVTGDATAGLGAVADPSGGNWSGEYLEPGSIWAAGEANVTFTDNKTGAAGAGGGNYALSGLTNAAYGRVPGALSSGMLINGVAVSRATLKYDLAGIARKTDGRGAAGAYETTQNPPISGAGGGTVGAIGGGGDGDVAVQGGGGGSVGGVGGTGAGGFTPATGTGGGAIGGVGGAGSGVVTTAPITATGAITASPERTIKPKTVPAGQSMSAALPAEAEIWEAPFDPSDRAPYAIDFSEILGAGEQIAQIDKVTMSAQGVSLGIEVDASSGRTPIISTDRDQVQLWPICSPSFQTNAAFVGIGVQVGISVLIRTDTVPYRQYERTGVLPVRQQ